MYAVPLRVRLVTSASDKHITRRLRDLSFRSVVPGGYASATLTFDQPLAANDPAVGVYGKVYIYDGRTGATVWEGRQEDPGRGASTDGQVWTLNAFGPSAHVEDRLLTVCYVETATDQWYQSAAFGRQDGQMVQTDDNPPRVKLTIPRGAVLTTNQFYDAQSRLLNDMGQNLARATMVWASGVTDANTSVSIMTEATVGGAATTAATATMNTAGGTLTAVITTNFAAGQQVVNFRLRYTGAGATIADDVHWATASVAIRGTLYNASGVEQTAAATYTADTVLSSDVVKDLLGRVLNQFDGANATIATTSYAIDRLVYEDPVTAGQILADLMTLDSAYYWAAWESTSTGKARFEWSQWPTTVRYETSITGDFDSPGDVGDLYNAALVRYTDRNGRPRSVRVTSTQTDLAAAGLTREALVDLGDNIGSTNNATQAGTRYLADHNTVPNAGTITIGTPVLDLVNGRTVQPWELVPGTLIRVRGVLPRVDALNATDRDAVTVFRVLSVEYRASDNTATLELDSYPRSLANQLMSAHKKIDRRRRR